VMAWGSPVVRLGVESPALLSRPLLLFGDAGQQELGDAHRGFFPRAARTRGPSAGDSSHERASTAATFVSATCARWTCASYISRHCAFSARSLLTSASGSTSPSVGRTSLAIAAAASWAGSQGSARYRCR